MLTSRPANLVSDAGAAHGLFQPRHSGVVVLVAPQRGCAACPNGSSAVVRHLLAKVPFRRCVEVAADGVNVQWSHGTAHWRPGHLVRIVGEVVGGVRDDLRMWPYEGDEDGVRM